MPPRRDIYSSFSDPNSFLGQPFIPRVASAVAGGAGNIARAEDQFRSDVMGAAQRGIQNLGRLAATVGSALTFPIRAAQEAVSGAPLIAGTALGRTQQATTPEPRVPAFPSGMTGTYSPVSQVAPTIPTPTVQQPQTQVASVNPRPATADDLDAFYRRGAYAPQPAAQVAQPTPQRTAIQTPYGTIYATQQQASNLAAAPSRTIDQQSTRSPAEQQALLAQMRERGAAIGQRLAGQQEAFFAQKRAERSELARATAEAAKAGVSPQTIREARRAYTSQQPSSIAGTQQQFASFLTTPSFGPTPMANRTAFVRAPFGIPSGGPQPAQMQTTAAAPQPPPTRTGLNTTQRSWDDYVGPNPIESRVGTPFYDRSPRYGRRV